MSSRTPKGTRTPGWRPVSICYKPSKHDNVISKKFWEDPIAYFPLRRRYSGFKALAGQGDREEEQDGILSFILVFFFLRK
jgi:hypothetical protein